MATSRENKTISNFKAALIGGGARPNLFEVELTTLPAGISWDADNFRYMCKAAQLPASTIAQIDVPFRGRIFKVAGDRTIDQWSVTIINDENFRIRNAMEQWVDLIAKLDNNLGATDPTAYMTNAKVFQLGRGSSPNSTTNAGDANTVLKEYEFIDIFPTNVAAIDLSYDSSDAIEEFTVDFQVNSFSLTGAGGPNG
jgi:hypothetical protein|tara:strand:- start:500 stop:1090 length:591 start_codon:yes stop_codon:yes gene_type:complete